MGPAVSRARIATLVAVALAVVVLAVQATRHLAERAEGGLEQRLEGRGRVALVVGGEGIDIHPEGAELIALARLPRLRAALAGHDPAAVVAAMRAERVEALVVGGAGSALDGPDATIEQRLRAYARVPALRALYLAPAASLYVPEPLAPVPAPLAEALARVAREILEGKAPPDLASFPAALRARAGETDVEVMVLLREGSQPRLWRSARESSVAAGLITATSYARQRWIEREQAMGGPLARMLPHLEVEVALLVEDGTLGARDEAFVERVFTGGYGVALELRSTAWRYLLPAATRGEGSAPAAYAALLAQSGLSKDTLELPDCRLYRLAVVPLSVSSAPASRAFVLPD
jgi:hypothetical protein